jgi:hypothetical protein
MLRDASQRPCQSRVTLVSLGTVGPPRKGFYPGLDMIETDM